MKDSYSFDRDEAGLDESFQKNRRRLRPDLRALRARGARRRGGVRDDGRQRERATSSRRQRPARTRSSTARTATTRPTSTSRRPSRGRRSSPDGSTRRRRSTRQASTTIEGLAELLGHRRRGDVEGDAGREVGRHASSWRWSEATTGSSESKLAQRSSRATSARPRTRRSGRLSAPAAGSLGPVGVDVEVIADETLREGQFVAGANVDGRHLRGVEAGRDYEPRFADIREPQEGDACPVCGGRLSFRPAIEVGHIFKLGTFYSQPFGAMFLDEDGAGAADRDGQLRHRARRGSMSASSSSTTTSTESLAASVAPYDVHVVVLAGVEEPGGRGGRGARTARRNERPARRPRPASRGEVRRRRPDRHARPGSRSGRRRSRTAPSTSETRARARSGACPSPRLETR